MRRVFSCALVALAACAAVEGTPRSLAPLNVCSDHACNLYRIPAGATIECPVGTCELQGRPAYTFALVVSVPDDSLFAPSSTFYVPSDDLFAGGTTKTTTTAACAPPTCIALPSLTLASGRYTVDREASTIVGLPLDDGTSIPVDVTFVPLADNPRAPFDPALPFDALYADSRLVEDPELGTTTVEYTRSVPTGSYQRLTYPEPPYDAVFPPAIETLHVTAALAEYHLGKAQLDDPSGDSRLAVVRRASGLDGFTVWLRDTESNRRVSVLRSLKGVQDSVRLDTIGQNASNGGIRDRIDVVVAPPAGWVGFPRLESPLTGGTELKSLEYPELPAPVSVTGLVAAPNGADQATLASVPSHVTFTSTKIVAENIGSPLLHYATELETDAEGRFATVLPPGDYDVVVDPGLGTGYARTPFSVEALAPAVVSLAPKKRSALLGHATLTDGRVVADSDVLAVPRNGPAAAPSVLPRPAMGRTGADGSFHIEVDEGEYAVSIVPPPGSSFPRTFVVAKVAGEQTDLGLVWVPLPTRVGFTLRAPSSGGGTAGTPISHALVRAFAKPLAGGNFVEVGRAQTTEDGDCEILLAQEAR